ncbi:MAG: PEP/pyruvate-binding domain-containing protein [Candidatus Levyibacteriota bacterium]
MTAIQRFVVDLKRTDEDSWLLGKLGSELASLAALKINIPQGFIITSEAYFKFLGENNLRQKIRHLLTHFDGKDKTIAQHIKNNILKADIPKDLLSQIFTYYRSLGWKDKTVTLIPSSTDPHLKLTSKINVKGEAVLIQDIKEIWASYFENDLLMYREHRNLSHFRTAVAIIVQKDLYLQKSGYVQDGNITLGEGPTLSEGEEKELLALEQKIKAEYFFSKKINWVVCQGKIYITGISCKRDAEPEKKQIGGSCVDISYNNEAGLGGRIVTGVIKVINDSKDMNTVGYDEILILNGLKNYEDIKSVKHAKALVVDSEIANLHLKSVLEQMRLPVVVDKNAKASFKNGTVVTVDGTRGQVYQGKFRLE